MTHGTLTAYTNDRCRCDACRAANSAYGAAWQRQSRAGHKQTTDATEAREHIERLIEAGFTCASIATFAGVSDQAISNIRRGLSKRVRHATAEGILGITLTDAAAGHHTVPSTGARRLLAAMREAGVGAGEIVRWLGYASSSSSVPTARNPRIRARNHERVVTLYKLLARRGVVPAGVLEEVAG